MRMRIRFGPVLVLTIAVPMIASAQRSQSPEEYDREATTRVKALSERLRFRENDPVDRRRYYAELKEVTKRLRTEVDRYIHVAFSPTEASSSVQGRLRTLLAEHKPNPDYGDLALARIGDLRGGQSLLVAYAIVRPPHHDAATIRGYRLGVDGYDLMATTGDDFDGYGMFKQDLQSPIPGELWLLTWGQAHTFNGTKIRFRVYAFDGEKFRTVWSPDDLFDATVRFSDSGFAIDHHVRQPPSELHDEYVLTPDGPVKTLSR
jgi:hypothetical protein